MAQKFPVGSFPTGHLKGVVDSSRNHKARLLHYFPPPATSNAQQAWCGWHTDHGSLTGLASAIYMREGGVEVPCPDPEAGLYIRNRHGDVVKVAIPPDHIGFQVGKAGTRPDISCSADRFLNLSQVGEAMQVHSGGLLRATPHYVRTASSNGSLGISRSTFAVFMQPDMFQPLDAPLGGKRVFIATATGIADC